MPKIDQHAFAELAAYLKAHEDDIAKGINDFGELQYVYKAVMGSDAGQEAAALRGVSDAQNATSQKA